MLEIKGGLLRTEQERYEGREQVAVQDYSLNLSFLGSGHLPRSSAQSYRQRQYKRCCYLIKISRQGARLRLFARAACERKLK